MVNEKFKPRMGTPQMGNSAHSARPLCHIVFFKGERGLLIGGSLPHNLKDWKLFPTCKACESKRTEYCAKYEKLDKQ